VLFFAGLSHHTAPLDLRERCAVPTEERARAGADLRRRFGSAVLLSTCGRIELYADAPHDDHDHIVHEALTWLARRADLDFGALRPYAETAVGERAVERAVRVACGLESALEGEDEILGQVRRAWLDAGLAGGLSPALDAAFRLAVRTGRQARRLGSTTAWTSLADTAAAHVALAVGELAAPRVLIAGSGPMGLRAAHALRERFGTDLEMWMAGRTPERVTAHAAQVGAEPLLLADIPRALDWADAAVVGLRTRTALVGAGNIAPRPDDRPLLIVDLSLPRAIEAAAGDVTGVTLRNVDHLTTNEGRHSRWDAEGRARVERLVQQALADYTALTERSDAAATLAALRIQADGIRRAQLERTLRRLPHLDAEARWALDALTRAIVNRVLHEPTMRLKGDIDGAVTEQVRAVFGMMRDT
jgi:glutamyl-tRNA reductase